MDNERTPGALGSNDGLGHLLVGDAFNRWLTGPSGSRLRCVDVEAAYRAGWKDAVASESERWRRIAEAAQAVTAGAADGIDAFVVPSHLMAALALALDEGPND